MNPDWTIRKEDDCIILEVGNAVTPALARELLSVARTEVDRRDPPRSAVRAERGAPLRVL